MSYSMKTLQKHILVLFRLYNSKLICTFWISCFGKTLGCFWTVAYHQRFGRLLEF